MKRGKCARRGKEREWLRVRKFANANGRAVNAWLRMTDRKRECEGEERSMEGIRTKTRRERCSRNLIMSLRRYGRVRINRRMVERARRSGSAMGIRRNDGWRTAESSSNRAAVHNGEVKVRRMREEDNLARTVLLTSEHKGAQRAENRLAASLARARSVYTSILRALSLFLSASHSA